MTAPEPADLARQHGAPWAKQLTQDELMKMEQYDFGASEKPAKRTPGLVLIFVGLIAVLFTLMIAHLVVRSGVAGWW